MNEASAFLDEKPIGAFTVYAEKASFFEGETLGSLDEVTVGTALSLAEVERRHVLRVLEQAGGNSDRGKTRAVSASQACLFQRSIVPLADPRRPCGVNSPTPSVRSFTLVAV